jgi:hypothetical protein
MWPLYAALIFFAVIGLIYVLAGLADAIRDHRRK